MSDTWRVLPNGEKSQSIHYIEREKDHFSFSTVSDVVAQLNLLERDLAQAKAAGGALAEIVRAYAKQYTDPRSRNGKRNSTALAQWEKLTKSHLAKDPAKAEDEGHD